MLFNRVNGKSKIRPFLQSTSGSKVMVLVCTLAAVVPLPAGAAKSAQQGECQNEFPMVFLDEQDLADARGVRFVAHPVSDACRTTIVTKDPARENLWYMPVSVVPRGDIIQMWYQRVEKNLPNHRDQRVLCYGFFDNSGRWTEPDLGLYTQPWKGPNNILMLRSPHRSDWGGFNVHQILLTEHMKDTPRRYSMVYWDAPERGSSGVMLAFSTDGIHWEKEERKDAVFTERNDAYTIVKVLGSRKYLMYQTALEPWEDKPIKDNIGNLRRIITIRQSEDLVHWTPQEIVLRPDADDPPSTEFYLLKVFAYHKRYLGLIMKYHSNIPGKHGDKIETELVFSRDGRIWQRTYRNTDLGFWSYADSFMLGDDLSFVFHHDGSIDLGRYRRDGLISVAAQDKGCFATRSFNAPKHELRLNAYAPDGTISVEVLDNAGKVVPGFEREKCTFTKADGVHLRLTWGLAGIDSLCGRRIQLRFYMDKAHIYALW